MAVSEPAIQNVASQTTGPIGPVLSSTDRVAAAGLSDIVALLEEKFKQSFAVIDLATGRLEQVSADWLGGDLFTRLTLCEEIARRGSVEAIEDFAPLLMVAIPLTADGEPTDFVAISTFLTQPVTDEEDVRSAAEAFGVDSAHAFRWSRSMDVWPPHAVLHLAEALQNSDQWDCQIEQLNSQLTDVSAHLLSTFEELNLLHRLSERLSISSSETELGDMALTWLGEIVPAENLVLMFEGWAIARTPGDTDEAPSILNWGKRLLDDTEYPQFIDRLGPKAKEGALVLNRDKTSHPTWGYPDIREAIAVPIRTGDRVLGWILSFNHDGSKNAIDDEFGTVEASLLSSVAAILGVHAGNMHLYRERNDFFESVIRALSSAIDAKDPYTCGHSDRVARIAVCLARQMGCEAEDLNTIYLSGLLHDIGKIGIDDNVLRKPGKLTKEEYEHIKQHPELGHHILKGVKQLDKVLPVVLHHHEAWDGSGYPAGLIQEECPLLARITAVADSVDAMGSDRPYRKGMPAEKLDSILKAGAGRQWDPQVVQAFFDAREQVAQVTATERAPKALDVRQWEETSGRLLPQS